MLLFNLKTPALLNKFKNNSKNKILWMKKKSIQEFIYNIDKKNSINKSNPILTATCRHNSENVFTGTYKIFHPYLPYSQNKLFDILRNNLQFEFKMKNFSLFLLRKRTWNGWEYCYGLIRNSTVSGMRAGGSAKMRVVFLFFNILTLRQHQW